MYVHQSHVTGSITDSQTLRRSKKACFVNFEQLLAKIIKLLHSHSGHFSRSHLGVGCILLSTFAVVKISSSCRCCCFFRPFFLCCFSVSDESQPKPCIPKQTKPSSRAELPLWKKWTASTHTHTEEMMLCTLLFWSGGDVSAPVARLFSSCALPLLDMRAAAAAGVANNK
jgi:hypothetical protein